MAAFNSLQGARRHQSLESYWGHCLIPAFSSGCLGTKTSYARYREIRQEGETGMSARLSRRAGILGEVRLLPKDWGSLGYCYWPRYLHCPLTSWVNWVGPPASLVLQETAHSFPKSSLGWCTPSSWSLKFVLPNKHVFCLGELFFTGPPSGP